jgi:hypothetical protein
VAKNQLLDRPWSFVIDIPPGSPGPPLLFLFSSVAILTESSFGAVLAVVQGT